MIPDDEAEYVARIRAEHNAAFDKRQAQRAELRSLASVFVFVDGYDPAAAIKAIAAGKALRFTRHFDGASVIVTPTSEQQLLAAVGDEAERQEIINDLQLVAGWRWAEKSGEQPPGFSSRMEGRFAQAQREENAAREEKLADMQRNFDSVDKAFGPGPMSRAGAYLVSQVYDKASFADVKRALIATGDNKAIAMGVLKAMKGQNDH